ncbi:MAG: hypothetical protein Q9163_005970 [Psora crenata]
MKLVMSTSDLSQKCRICDKIDTKQRRRAAEKDRINRWKKEGGKFKASIERSEDIVRQLELQLRRFLAAQVCDKFTDGRDKADTVRYPTSCATSLMKNEAQRSIADDRGMMCCFEGKEMFDGVKSEDASGKQRPPTASPD